MLQPTCINCKFLGIHIKTYVCILFNARLTGEPIQCQGKIMKKLTKTELNKLDELIAYIHPDEAIFDDREVQSKHNDILQLLATVYPMEMPNLVKLSNEQLYKYCNELIKER